MDLLSGFQEIDRDLVADEALAKKYSDHIVYTADALRLEDLIDTKRSTVIRNGFLLKKVAIAASNVYSEPRADSHWQTQSKLRILYVGAISHWFDCSLFIDTISKVSDVEVLVVGRDEIGLESRSLAACNDTVLLRFLGEVPHPEACQLMCSADVGLIPLDDSCDLIRCTNPVKLYEYLHYGCQVLSTNIPEVLLMQSPDVFCSSSSKEWAYALSKMIDSFDYTNRMAAKVAINERSSLMLSGSDWASRGDVYFDLLKLIQADSIPRRSRGIASSLHEKPVFSVIIPSIGCHETLLDCIKSLLCFYSSAIDQIVLVVNGPFTKKDKLEKKILQQFPGKITVIHTLEKLGFAKAVNLGVRECATDLAMICNDDIIFSPWSLLPYLELPPSILSNNCINIATTNIDGDAFRPHDYFLLKDFYRVSLSRYSKYGTSAIGAARVGLNFCSITVQNFLEVGGIPEDYGLGYFEDDAFYMKLRDRGIGIKYLPGAYAHHVGSLTFQSLGATTRFTLIKNNRKLLESESSK
ncbi:glycosyltransferase [Cyanobium usitatum]|uniref:glycosyltransferase n=1 Tax=Cyanobium usitatum TaxID=2304190 RepID=UPI002AD2A444|nr:glycosyltransferase [Cyanobium usitatum]